MCPTCGQKATEFHEHAQELELRHLGLYGRQGMLGLRPKRYRCRYCEGALTTTERAEWYDAKAGCTKAYAEFLLLERVNGTLEDALRKIEMKELKAILTKEEYARLKGVLGALRKRHENLEPEEQALLDGLFEASLSLRKAYNLREKLTRLFDKKHSKKSGRRAIRRWMAAVRESGLNCFDNFLTPLENRMDTITNYFISRSSSGWVEGLNNKIGSLGITVKTA